MGSVDQRVVSSVQIEINVVRVGDRSTVWTGTRWCVRSIIQLENKALVQVDNQSNSKTKGKEL